MIQAGVYSAVMHYLKAVHALGSDADGAKVVAKMKEMPTDDKLFGKGTDRSFASGATTTAANPGAALRSSSRQR